MKTYLKYCLFAVIMVFAACENREWDNPFDPDCPKELFTPANFTAKQEGTLVKLTWIQSNTQISGFVIERSIDGGATWSSLATPTKTELTWSDPNISGGKEHKYRLIAKAGNNSSNEVTAQVTPVFASTLSTSPLTKLLSTSAILGGEITSDGGSPVTVRGVCWSTSPNPTTNNSKTTDGTGIGAFTSTIAGLNTTTTYYARAYSTTSIGTSYGNEISFKTFFGEVTDIEGNVYPTVKIGEQVWMAENLKTTKYNDGTAIPNVIDNTAWAGLTTGAYCWYNNDVNNKNTYGVLYNWSAVNTNKLAPTGWHVPTDAEWTTLTTYLGGESIAGGKLKEIGTTHWQIPNTGATNESVFTTLPGGARYVDGTFVNLGSNGGWWSSTTYDTQTVWIRDIYRAEGKISRGYAYNQWGYSVRCILGALLCLPTATISGGTFVCRNSPSPEITFTGTSGTAPFVFTYRINTGTNQTIKTTSGNSLKLQVPTNNPGKYTYSLVSVTDANGCAQNQAGEAVFEIKSAPTATVSGTQNVCQNTPYPNVTLTGNGGTQPYTFTYNIDGGANKTVSTTSGNSVTIQIPTENVGVFKYNLVGVMDASVSACNSPQTGAATITVNQPPTEMTLINKEFCNGVATTIISFSNTVVGTTYTWTNSNTSIGLAASGTGNIPSFIAKNSTSSPIASTISVTPKTNGCNGISQTFTITVNPPPDANFAFTNDNTCSGTPIKFTPVTTGNYSYNWDFGDYSKSIEATPQHIFKAIGSVNQTFKVKLIMTNNSTSCRDSLSKIVTVKQASDAALNTDRVDGATWFDKTNKLFVNCMATQASPQFTFVAVNASSTRATNTGYSIDWDDGTQIENLPVSFSKTTHTYNSLGFFNIKITSINDNAECKSGVTTYKFFNGNSPAGNLGSIGNTDDCAPYTLKWPIQNTSSNPPGTTYEFSVNDGSPPQKFDQSNLPDSIPHTFTKTSCGYKDNKFTVSFSSKNPCDNSTSTLQVMASEKPTAKFDIGSNLNLNNTVRFTNASSGSYIIGNTCVSNFNKTWTITPNTGWTGNLTNSNFIDVKFNVAGEYQIKLKIEKPYSSDSKCNSDSITKIITINP